MTKEQEELVKLVEDSDARIDLILENSIIADNKKQEEIKE